MIKIAIDGPGGAGKSSVAKAVAKKLGIVYVDTGALYRTIGYFVRSRDVDPHDRVAVPALLGEISIEVKYENGTQKVYLNGEDLGDKIRTPEMSMYASAVSAIPEVRAFLLDTQRDIAKKNSVIMDGRDIGTVILPDAEVKIFMTASPECRAKRRYDELIAKGADVKYEDVLNEMNERDHNDSTRDVAPTAAAEDSVLLDTSELDFDASVDAVIEIVKSKTEKGGSDGNNGNKETTSEKKTEKKNVKHGNKSGFFKVCYALFAGIVKVLFNIRVVNGEKEPDEGGYLICSNHVSAIDAIVICYAFRKNQARLMAKKELFKIPLLAQLIKMLGAFPIDRSGGDVGALKKAIAMLKEGMCIGIFPQGHRHPGVDPRTTPVKGGVGLICRRSGCDVMPVYIVRKNNRFRLFGKTYIIFGDLMKNESFAGLNNDEVANVIFDKICTIGENSVNDPRIKIKHKK